MIIKIILGIILLVEICIGSNISENRYSFFKNLPAVKDEQRKIINGKRYDENGKLFSGRIKLIGNGYKYIGDNYMYIYSYENGEPNGLYVIYYKQDIKEIGYMKNGE
ncbi:hypothetical protein [Fusobacterium ulcerans]